MTSFMGVGSTLRRAAALLAFSVVAATAAFAQNGATAQNVDENGVMLSGHDVVAYQTQQKAVQGTAEFTAVHDGAIYRFASSTNRDAFRRYPAKYAPAYGGYCAMGVAVGKKLGVDPNAFTISGGQLFLNVNKDVQAMFSKDVAGNNTKAGQNWAKVQARTGFDKM